MRVMRFVVEGMDLKFTLTDMVNNILHILSIVYKPSIPSCHSIGVPMKSLDTTLSCMVDLLPRFFLCLLLIRNYKTIIIIFFLINRRDCIRKALK